MPEITKQIRKSILLFSLSFLTVNGVHAQSYTKDYSPLVSSGKLPEEFVKTAREMSEADIKTVGYGTDRIAKMQFVMANNYFLKDLLMSGNVLINDPLTVYVNKVADELLKDNKALRSQLHIYVTKSSDVNAHAFDKGFIFINVGLLAQLENEAQLAFILSHEITHVLKKHSVNEYIENIKLENGTSDYERGSYDDRNLAKYRFSKEQESEADIEGLNLVKKTNYSIKTLNGAFDVLQYSYLPFELLDFKKSFLEDEYMVLPDTLFLKKTSEVKSNDDYDDSKSTHPNIRKRRGNIEPDLRVADESNRKKYLVSETEFKNTREIARFELCKLYLAQCDYVNAIYAAYILLQKYPDNLYLKKIISTGLYNISVNKSHSDHSSYISISDGNMGSKTYEIEDYKKIEGASQRLYYMLDNLSDKELNVVALSYTYKAHKQYPKDSTLSSLTDSLLSELVNSNSLYPNDFSRQTKAEIRGIDTVKTVKADTTADVEESKYSKIKKQQQKVEIETDDNFIKYSLVGLFKDNEFVDRYMKMSKGLMQERVKKDELSYKQQREKDKYKKKSPNEKLLGIQKVIFIDPYYMRVKSTGDGEVVNYYESEDQQQVLTDIQKKCADRLGLSYVMVTTKKITTTDMGVYNDNGVINEWLRERFKHGEKNEELVSSTEDIKKLVDRLGTKYIAWSGIYNIKGRSHRNTYFFIVINIESGEIMKFETRYTQGRDNDDILNSFVYNSLMHVVKKEKQ